MEITIETTPNSILLRLAGDFRLWGNEEEEQNLVRAIRTVGQQFPEHLVLSLARMQRVDSAGIGCLVRVVLECVRRNAELLVVMPRGVAGEAVRRMRIFDSWAQFQDEAAALQSLTQISRLAMTA